MSLRTADKSEIFTRNASVLAYLENVFAALRCTKPRSLSHRECVGLSGGWYRGWASEETARHYAKVEPESPEFNEQLWKSVLAKEQKRIDSGETQREIAPRVDAFLLGKGLRIDTNSTEMLLRECAKARLEGIESQLRNAKGDYSPDPKAGRFPPSLDLTQAGAASDKGLTLDALFKKWRDHPENKRTVSQATVRAYDRAFRALDAFVAEKRSVPPLTIPAASITRAEIQQFAERRLDDGTSITTVNDGDLAALKSILGWAVKRGLMTGNAADGIRFKEDKKGKRPTGKTGFTEEEAIAILRHALAHRGSGRESAKMEAAKRWVPWLQAYSGTRVGEMGQLRRQDIRLHNGRWALEVTPDAGKQKRGNAWLIPLHPHLLELGFVEFVKAAPAGHLFITPNPKVYKADAPDTRSKDPRGILGPLSALNNRLAEFAREVVKRPDVAPTHGWRHRFKAKGRLPSLNIHPFVLDAFSDHAPRTEGEGYGFNDLFEAMAEAIDRVPRYKVE
ncbi:MAG: site-specific integrase [Proteobacteria bacterium]|nr:site-specific integrase [Pseudomonadota bacterium]